MTLGVGRIALLAVLIGAFGSGCGGAGSGAAAGPTELPSPRPSGDARPGTAAVLTGLARGNCPARAPVLTSDRDLGSPLDDLKAVKMVLCRYRGGNDTPPLGRRSSATVTNPATAESWRRRFNALPTVDPGKYHCPFDDESAVLAAFQGQDGTVVVARLSLRGCRFVTIGGTTVSTAGSPSLRDDLLRLVP